MIGIVYYNVVTKPNSLKFRAADALATDTVNGRRLQQKAKHNLVVLKVLQAKATYLKNKTVGMISTNIFTKPIRIIVANAKVFFKAYQKPRPKL